ncbi:MAG: PadR family transcriptional regulator [Nitrososphaerales archaeon]
MLTRKKETGYSIMQSINEKTKGTWRPGPGTIYPLLRRLAKEGLTRPVVSRGKERESIPYGITEKGEHELDEMRSSLCAHGVERSAMMSFFAELLPGSYFASFFPKHFVEECNVFSEKVLELPNSSREISLKEMKVVLEKQLSWVNAQLLKK